MKKLKKLMVAAICVANAYYANPQDMRPKLVQAKETVVKKVLGNSKNTGEFFGRSGTKIVFNRGSDNNLSLFYLDEQNFTFLPDGKEIYISKERILYRFNLLDSLIFYMEVFFDLNNPSYEGYRQLIIRIFDKEILLDSIFNCDKQIHSSFSGDGKYLIINTLDERPEMYDPYLDDQFIVYDVDDLRRGKVTRSVVPCQYCASGYLMNNKLIFTQSSERDDFEGGYGWHDIYVAPWGKLKDSVKVAFRTDIIAVSPDGRYILVKRNDLPNGVCAIIDVSKKKYQLLLGRDYNKYPAFYSYAKEKFAFDFGEHIIYVDFPEEYPFDALKYDWQLWEPMTVDVRKQFQHEPLK